MANFYSIKNWPSSERPRERLFKLGEHTLSDAELLAIILKSGTRGKNALDLARELLTEFKGFRDMGHLEMRRLLKFKGLGLAKIAQLRAAIEIGRRFMTEKKRINKRVRSAKEVAEFFMPRLRDLKREVFKILLLDGQNNIMDTVEIEEGTVIQANPHIREIISKGLQSFAAGMIALHNHPSGDPKPSKEDKAFTEALQIAGNIMQINVLDHIIIGDNRYFSFSENGLIKGFS